MKYWIKQFIRSGIVCIVPLSVYAAEIDSYSTATLHNLTVESRLSYEQYHMPDQIPAMGVMGLHGLIDFDQSFYGGLGLYS
ncbi:hypothetical protein N9Q05_02380, partial [bacterium]|nr:hypothetical protein [bacterium]